MAHIITSPKKQPQFPLMTIRQYWLGETKPKKALSGRPETLSTSCYGIFKIIYLMEFSTDVHVAACVHVAYVCFMIKNVFLLPMKRQINWYSILH